MINKNPTILESNEASVLRNVDFGNYGGLRIREGYKQSGTSLDPSGTVTWDGSIKRVITSSSGTRLVIAFLDGSAYYRILPSDAWVQFSTGFSKKRKWGGTVFGNKLYYGNDIDPVHVFNLATLTDSVLVAVSGTVPIGNIFAVFKGRLMIAGGTVIGASKVADPTRWDTSVDGALYQIVGALDGYKIMGVANKSNVLKIIRNNGKVYSLDFDANGVASLDEEGVILPCTSEYGIVEAENDIFTIGKTGVYSYGLQMNFAGGDRPGEVSSAISPLFDPTHPNPEYPYNITNIEDAAGVYYRGNIIYSVSISDSGSNNRCIVFRPKEAMPWTEWTGWAVSSFIVDEELDELYLLSSTNADVFKVGGYSDNGTAIDFHWESGDIAFDEPRRSQLRYVNIDGSANQFLSGTFSVFRDHETVEVENVSTWPLTNGTVVNGTASGELGKDMCGIDIVGDSTAGTMIEKDNFQSRKGMILKAKNFRFKIRVNQADVEFEINKLSPTLSGKPIQSFKSDET